MACSRPPLPTRRTRRLEDMVGYGVDSIASYRVEIWGEFEVNEAIEREGKKKE